MINKTAARSNRVNHQLDKLDEATDSAVDAVQAVDEAVRAVSFAVKTPVKKSAGAAAGLSSGFATLRRRRDLRAAKQSAKEAAARREADLEDELRNARGTHPAPPPPPPAPHRLRHRRSRSSRRRRAASSSPAATSSGPRAAGGDRPTLFGCASTAELREGFQRFYEERGHLRIPSHPLIPPDDDPSTLFIVAGMQPFKPYFLGVREPPAKRAVSAQKVLRAGGKDTDLEDVGRTDRHCSFFEMLGNFSFGDYFKDGAVDFAWEFVTEQMKLDPERLWATVHEGNPVLELDEDSVAIEAWKRVGIPPSGSSRLGKDNFWQAADTGRAGRARRSSTTAARSTAAAAPTAARAASATATWSSTTSSSCSTTCARATSSCRCRARASTPAWASSGAR